MLNRELIDTLWEAKTLCCQWVKQYNTVRPHNALDVGYPPGGMDAASPWRTDPCNLASGTKTGGRSELEKAKTMSLRTVAYYIFYSPLILLAFLRRHIDSSLDKILLKQGKKVEATITSCICIDDTTDDEHNIFEIEFEYFINNRKVKKNTRFSINTAHIEYAHLGELFDVPRLKYSLLDFKKSLEPGNKIDIITLGKWPFHYVNQFNPICREVMSIPQVWS